MTQTFTILSDPGHGWLVIDAATMADLGIEASHLTEFSFVRDGIYYAEEDCDMATVIAAYHRKHGELPTFREQHISHDAACRHFTRCPGTDPQYKAAWAYLNSVKGERP